MWNVHPARRQSTEEKKRNTKEAQMGRAGWGGGGVLRVARKAFDFVRKESIVPESTIVFAVKSKPRCAAIAADISFLLSPSLSSFCRFLFLEAFFSIFRAGLDAARVASSVVSRAKKSSLFHRSFMFELNIVMHARTHACACTCAQDSYDESRLQPYPSQRNVDRRVQISSTG